MFQKAMVAFFFLLPPLWFMVIQGALSSLRMDSHLVHVLNTIRFFSLYFMTLHLADASCKGSFAEIC